MGDLSPLSLTTFQINESLYKWNELYIFNTVLRKTSKGIAKYYKKSAITIFFENELC